VTEQTTKARELVVNRGFDVGQLRCCSYRLECYTLLGAGRVMIKGKGNVSHTVRFVKRKNQIVCDCRQARRQGGCDHQQALSKGLWGRLAALPRRKALVTVTQDWCDTPATLVQSMLFPTNWEVAFAPVRGG